MRENNKKQDKLIKPVVFQMMSTKEERRARQRNKECWGWGGRGGRGHPRKVRWVLAGSIPEPLCCHPLSALAPSPDMRLLHRRLLRVIVPLRRGEGG